jgi:hypothetical protein
MNSLVAELQGSTPLIPNSTDEHDLQDVPSTFHSNNAPPPRSILMLSF